MEKLQKLKDWFKEKEKVIVAFSGGVDSTLLLAVAVQVLGDKVMAVTVDSPLNVAEERREAENLAQKLGVKHLVVEFNDLKNPLVASNPEDRCYHCKKSRFEHMISLAQEKGFAVIVEGSNLDDLSDYRPGLQAVEELNIASPLQDVGLYKKEIREIARYLQLPVWDKPSEPCLATRVPFATEITKEKLARISNAEKYLKKELNCSIVRVRDHQDLARIEIKEDEFTKILGERKNICAVFSKLGYQYVTLDIMGYRTGSMNKTGGKN